MTVKRIDCEKISLGIFVHDIGSSYTNSRSYHRIGDSDQMSDKEVEELYRALKICEAGKAEYKSERDYAEAILLSLMNDLYGMRNQSQRVTDRVNLAYKKYQGLLSHNGQIAT